MAHQGKVSGHLNQWHCRLELPSHRNRVRAQGSWKMDPGRGAHGAGGNGTVANHEYTFSDGKAGEGCLLARENGGFINYFTGDEIEIIGEGYVEFMMNDNKYGDNPPMELLVDVTPLK